MHEDVKPKDVKPKSLVWGRFAGEGEEINQISPCDGSLIATPQLLSATELENLMRDMPPAPRLSHDEIADIAKRLYVSLGKSRDELREALQRETGFINRDCDELIEGSLAYVEQFAAYFSGFQTADVKPIAYEANKQKRHIRLVRTSWGTVAVILPQNAFLLVALTAALNALATGNRVILRAPLQSAKSASLLAQVFSQAQIPNNAICVVLAKAKEFVGAVCAAPQPMLLHYMGSSQHAPGIIRQCFEAGKGAIADGAGNVWLFVDKNINPEKAASILVDGATRYNGQTCTSINGAIIHPAIYENVRISVREKINDLTTGEPGTSNCDIGPLFDEAQAEWCVEQMEKSGGAILGGGRKANLLIPALVEKPDFSSMLVAEGLFGPALWMAPGTRDEFIKLWPRNKYPLCAGILSDEKTGYWLDHLPNIARLVVNGDPSIEHIFEPWGGYPSSGANMVSIWHEKYTRVVSLDEAV